ncbi:histidine decarboxylase [Micromonospora fulviviridis]|uniref:histidine decarboxylase n=1 Tax=Micromonospora fulviviridis TaxID=47860 RepID=UPI0037ABA7D8
MTDSPTVALAEAADLSDAPIDVTAVLEHQVNQAEDAAPLSIGFPGAVDIDYSDVMARMGRRLWNNIGDPTTDPGGAAHTKILERAVIAWVAETLAMPADDRWGYVTTGGTEGNLAALHTAYRRHPRAIVYYSAAAHYSIPKVLGIIGAPAVVINANDDGEMNYEDLAAQMSIRRSRPAIVVATAGTTMTEAVDDTGRIRDAVAEHAADWHLHVDAALSGIPLALDGRLRLDNASGISSIAISGHKFFGTPTPCGIVLIRDSARRRGSHIAYTATLDTTITGSRCGLAATLLWHAIATYGRERHRWRVSEARHLAAYAVQQLTAVRWPAWRHPHAFTVVLQTPPAKVREKWLIATDGDVSHVICMPGISEGQINAFVADIAAANSAPPAPIPRPRATPLAGCGHAPHHAQRAAHQGIDAGTAYGPRAPVPLSDPTRP